MLAGHLDRVEFVARKGWYAFGWAADLERLERAVSIEILCGQKLVGEAVAEIFRDDLLQSGIGSGHHGFAAPLTLEFAAIEHAGLELAVRVAGSGQDLCPAQIMPFAPIIGRLEGVRDMAVYGWACDTVKPQTALTVDIYVDGEFDSPVVAEKHREDLAGYFSACYGFFWPVPRRYADGVPRRVEARIAERDVTLEGGPVEIILDERFFEPVTESPLETPHSQIDRPAEQERELLPLGFVDAPIGDLSIVDYLLDRRS